MDIELLRRLSIAATAWCCIFIAPEELKRFGGAQAYAQAIDHCLHTLAGMLTEPAQLRRLLRGDA
jgi:hypothetical protein